MIQNDLGGSNPSRWQTPAMRQPAAFGSEEQNISEAERWASMGAGAALVFSGLIGGRAHGLLMSLMGGALLYRGFTGHCHLYGALGIDSSEHNPATAVPAKHGVKFEKTIAVSRPAADLYQFWRNPANLPKVMTHLKEVRALNDRQSHWVAEGIAGQNIEWDAEIMNERANELIAWRSLPGGGLDTAGSIHFRPLGQEQGTSVTVSIKYNPPGGKLGATLASILGAGAEQKIEEDLRNFKRTMEAGVQPQAGQW